MAGYSRTKEILNARVGFLAVQVRDGLEEWLKIKAYCDAHPVPQDPQTDDLGLGFTADDAATIRASAAAMAQLHAVAHGQAAQSPASDFFWDAENLTAFD